MTEAERFDLAVHDCMCVQDLVLGKYDILTYKLNELFDLWRNGNTNTLKAIDALSLALYVSRAIT